MRRAVVVGGGLAGSEAAWQLAERGVFVELWDMKPGKMTPAHTNPDFAELVCSNSLRSDRTENAAGLLKAELRLLGSLIIACADRTRVEAGGALAVDRAGFAAAVTGALRAHPRIRIVEREAAEIPEGPVVIATGPLTSDALARAIGGLLGGAYLYFYDASAPLVMADSIDWEHAFLASRYDRGTPDYVNCPMGREEYERFEQALATAEEAEVHGFEDSRVFEGCMPIEVMARRGADTIRHGPLKPVGLKDPRTGREPYAVVQLRRDNAAGTAYNLVGFQTHLKHGEQKRVFSMIPALARAQFARYGVMHRNTFIRSPGLLGPGYELLTDPRIRFAGQMTGVEGYVESAASGFVAGLSLARELGGLSPVSFDNRTALGALSLHVSRGEEGEFQPMNINFGIMAMPDEKFRGKRDKYAKIADRSLSLLGQMLPEISEGAERTPVGPARPEAVESSIHIDP